MRRTQCSACSSDDLVTFLDLGTSPVADAYARTKSESLHLPRYPLDLAVCADCWLVQLLEVLPQEQLFGTGYHFYSSASPPLVDYHRRYAEEVLKREGDQRFVLEVGCNDGDMLRHFSWTTTGTVIGVDPARGPAEVARERGLDVRVRPFGKAFAQDLLDANGPATLIIANHVLAHVESVYDVLAGISNLLHPDGVAYVEVQYLPDLLVNNAFDLVYHEHRNFFSFTSLQNAAWRVGLVVRGVTQTNRQGGSIRVELVPRLALSSPDWEWMLKREIWLSNISAYVGVQGRVNRIKEKLQTMLYHLDITSKVVAGYGAPAKATTLLNFIEWTPAWVVDSTPAKQGCYVPGTTARIVHPEKADIPDVYLLLAWNYLAEILAKNPPSVHPGKWLIPIPAPVLL